MALTDIEKYQRKLKRLINNVPEGYKLCYDYMDTSIYVIAEDAEFFDNEPVNLSAIVGSTTPQNGMGFSSSTGNDKEKIVGDGIYISLEAVQN